VEDPQVDLVIAGRVRVETGEWARGEVRVTGERIVEISTDVGRRPAMRRIDVGEAFVLPGVVDAHVHCLSHPGEGVAAATAAAAAGGVTTIVEMPFDHDGPINTVDRFNAKRELIENQAHVDVAMLATLAPGGGWRAAQDLADAGAGGFKVSLFETDPRRFPRIDDAELLEVMAAVAGTGRALCVHAENNEIVSSLIASERQRNPLDPGAHSRSRPPVSETLGVLTALEIARAQGTRLHLCHLSLLRSVDLVRWYGAEGLDVSLETCPHYLSFTAGDLARHRGRLKINPPLRETSDLEGLWSRLISGAVDVIASDHAPWPALNKDHAEIFANHSGVPGVETILPVTFSGGLDRGDDAVAAAVDALTANPARRFGLGDRKGRLEAGFDADIAVFDPAGAQTLDEAALHSNADWSPYHGRPVRGRVSLTVLRGRVVWDGRSEGTGLPEGEGYGRVLEPVS